MIRVKRPEQKPAELQAGVERAQQHCDHFDQNRDWHCSAKGKFPFDKGVYGCPGVRETLPVAQFEKCCYCEAKFRHAAPGDVEHYRPKGGWKQGRSDRRVRPGYYWLAYRWTNLLWSCIECNRQAKANLFPLLDPASRALDHHCQENAEAPLLIDPTGPLDPREHIRFEEEVAKGVSAQGEVTIDVLRLNREPLLEARLGHLVTLRALRAAALIPAPEAAWAARQLSRAVLPQALFSAMAQDYLV